MLDSISISRLTEYVISNPLDTIIKRSQNASNSTEYLKYVLDFLTEKQIKENNYSRAFALQKIKDTVLFRNRNELIGAVGGQLANLKIVDFKISDLEREQNRLFVQNQRLSNANDSLQADLKTLDSLISQKQKDYDTLILNYGTMSILANRNDSLYRNEKGLKDELANKNETVTKLAIVAGALFLIATILAISFFKQKGRAQTSEVREKLLSRTMYQLGHLAPLCVDNLITSMEQGTIDQKQVITRLDNLSEILRKFYDYSKKKVIKYQDEYDLACAYVDLAYFTPGKDSLPSDIIECNYKEIPDKFMPTFVAFNAIQNAFKHGGIASHNAKDMSMPLLKLDLKVKNKNLFMVIENKKIIKKTYNKAGGGLSFIEGALQHWNGRRSQKYSSITDTKDTFSLTYTFIDRS